jgi:hypothetical protein
MGLTDPDRDQGKILFTAGFGLPGGEGLRPWRIATFLPADVAPQERKPLTRQTLRSLKSGKSLR